mmetsp:Transcript_15750/g.27971  ORF Transcript_15750/g.27971 Transcript_15750/m.27971 type:complete len:471 (-) Transcript_15750:509-1921(-)
MLCSCESLPRVRKGACRSCATVTIRLRTPGRPPPDSCGHRRSALRCSSCSSDTRQATTPGADSSLPPIASGAHSRCSDSSSDSRPRGPNSCIACGGEALSLRPASSTSHRLCPSPARQTAMEASLLAPKAVRTDMRLMAPSTAPMRAGTPSATSSAGDVLGRFQASSFLRLSRRASTSSSLGAAGSWVAAALDAAVAGNKRRRTAAQAPAALLDRLMSVDTFCSSGPSSLKTAEGLVGEMIAAAAELAEALPPRLIPTPRAIAVSVSNAMTPLEVAQCSRRSLGIPWLASASQRAGEERQVCSSSCSVCSASRLLAPFCSAVRRAPEVAAVLLIASATTARLLSCRLSSSSTSASDAEEALGSPPPAGPVAAAAAAAPAGVSVTWLAARGKCEARLPAQWASRLQWTREARAWMAEETAAGAPVAEPAARAASRVTQSCFDRGVSRTVLRRSSQGRSPSGPAATSLACAR